MMYKSCRLEKILSDRKFMLLLQVLFVGVCFGFLVYRVYFGIDFTDEGWYVAEPYVVAKGAVPIANLWNQSPGFAVPLAVLFKTYLIINKGTEGIILFSRLLYVVWLLGIGVLYVVLIPRTREAGKFNPIIVLMVFSTVCYSLFDINYNTIGLVYLLLACLLVLNDTKSLKWKTIQCLAGGVIMARAFIATPALCLAVVALAVVLFVRDKKALLFYFSGMMIAAALYFGYVIISGWKMSDVINGMYYTLHDYAYFKLPYLQTVFESIEFLLRYLFPLFLYFATEAIFYYMFRVKENKNRPISRLSIESVSAIHILIFLVIGIVLGDPDRWSWFGAPVLLIKCFLYYSDKIELRKTIVVTSTVTLLYFVTYLFASWTSNYGFGEREFWLSIPTCMTVYSICVLIGADNPYIGRIVLIIGLLCIAFISIKKAFSYVYRDDSMDQLNYRVESGIWKGLYTTEQRSKDVIALEEEIRRMTDNTKNVMFLDWVSFAYLMTDSELCAPSTLDTCLYSYDINDASILYDYFSLAKSVPQSIIYVDYGRDAEGWSFERDDWRFNKFVRSFYSPDEAFDCQTFRVLKCTLNGEDQELAMKYCLDNKTYR